MKELHNHIFSNTTCISKETMLKHINNQLSKKELHEVEKHLLDCELCSDAFEGIRYAENSSMLFAIDSTIKTAITKKKNDTPIFRNLLVAASVLVIVFGAYFSITFFNNTLDNNNSLALNKEELNNSTFKEELKGVFEEEIINENKSPLKGGDRGILAKEIDEEIAVEKTLNENNSPFEGGLRGMSDDKTLQEKESLEEDVDKKILPEEITDNKNVLLAEAPETIVETELMDVVNEEIIVGDVEEEEEMIERTGKVVEGQTTSGLSNTKSVGYVSVDEVLKKDELTKLESKSNNRNMKKSKSVVNEQVVMMTVAATETVKFKDVTQSNVIVINGYKVYDYRAEYETVDNLNDADGFVTGTVPTDYEAKTDKGFANKELKESTKEITYQEVLENAIKLYKNGQYKEALQAFDMIVAKHPKDVNAQFYMGLSYYKLGQNAAAIRNFDAVLKNKQTVFNEEANWHKVLTLLDMKNTTAAKKILKKIIKTNGTYKAKAEKKLGELF
ncbi:MAG: tetratricopeptide repeat protein [Vicingaceae bacterium]